ncbi:TPA: hypothetical protein DCG86_07395 [Candidatus Marinimicrobia bacterium]|nr:MAG: putative glycoside hydrolase [Marinimicrobia bacterium 46_47]HAE87833.1 hypothetical protein [Candidatus Neomarinimicrobiota bacterium]HBY18853.1 hypothetical protein [Candidatus Neomarinimicrobiota bacterium]
MNKVKKIMSLMFLIVLAFNSCIKSATYSMNDQWELLPDIIETLSIDTVTNHENWRSTEVPGSWHRLHPDLLDYQGVVWYRTSFKLKTLPRGKRILLKFGAVDYMATVFVNGEQAGEHEGGYTPFELDITGLVKEENNEIYVRVMDPTDDESGTDGISYWHIPHGKQNWYVQNSGIWQDVKIAVKPELYIESARVTAGINGNFDVQITVKNHMNTETSVRGSVTVKDPDGKIVFAEPVSPDLKKPAFSIQGRVENPRLWDIGRPNLYEIHIRLDEDSFMDHFGFRELKVHEGLFYLNGEPFYMMAALDQDFYPETVYETPSEAYLREQMLKAQTLGLNTLRCHIKVPDPRYLKVADELGILVWYELPNWDVFHEDVKERARKTFDAMLDRDWNHPSLVIIGLINESWGIDLSKPEQRAWLKEEFEYAKSEATGRLIVDNSACWGNFHLKTDINDYHTYWAIPDNHAQFRETVRDIAQRPSWLFSPHGDAEETGQEVLMISEFGNWGLPKLPAKKPFWFNRPFLDDWITLPEGVLERFEDYGYGRLFKDYDDLAETSQLAQVTALKWQIEEIRLHPEIQGYVITELTDINWESNGLLDMWRNYKKGYKILSQVQQPDMVIPRLDRYAFWEDETLQVSLTVSHYSRKDLQDIRLIVEENESYIGKIDLTLDSPGVYDAGIISVPAGRTSTPRRRRIDIKLLSEEGEILSSNFMEFMVFPRLREKEEKNLTDVLVTSSLDSIALDMLRSGKHVIVLLNQQSDLPRDFPYRLTSREADWYDGNWATNVNWVNNQTGPFYSINSPKTLGFEAYQAIPQAVLSGVPPEHFKDVLAGMFVGWMHLNSATVIQLKAGNGILILCTLNIGMENQLDPYCQTLLSAMKKYIRGDRCHPEIEWNLME